jgi:hypothetical protein
MTVIISLDLKLNSEETTAANRSHRSTMVGKMIGCMYDDTSSDKMEW